MTRILSILIVAVLLSSSFTNAPGPFGTFEIHGIDVSHHNGAIAWKTVKTNNKQPISFAFIKASEGTDFKDNTFATNWKGAKSAGLTVGAYHYFIPWSDPKLQFNQFKSIVKLGPGDFPPVLDVEESTLMPDHRIISNIKKWLVLAERHYGVRPIIYTNHIFYNVYIKNYFPKYKLWIAYYTDSKSKQPNYSKLHIWQYSKDGHVKGIKGKVDLNVYTKNKASFDNLLIKAAGTAK
jgi:lysozyme